MQTKASTLFTSNVKKNDNKATSSSFLAFCWNSWIDTNLLSILVGTSRVLDMVWNNPRPLCLENFMMILIRNCCLFHFLTVLSHIVKFLSMNNFKEYFLHYFLSRIRMLKPDSDPEKFENRNGTRPGSGSETLGTYQLKQSQVTCKEVFLKITL